MLMNIVVSVVSMVFKDSLLSRCLERINKNQLTTKVITVCIQAAIGHICLVHQKLVSPRVDSDQTAHIIMNFLYKKKAEYRG